MTRTRNLRHRSPVTPAARPQAPAVGMLLDLENLLHDARRVSGAAVRAGLGAVMGQLRGLGETRYAVGACDWWLAKSLCPTAAELGVRVHPGPPGRDRADGELLRRGSTDMPVSVEVVVIGSGDGAFAPLARAQRQAGRRVVVAGRAGHISRALVETADEVLLIDLTVDPVGLAA